MDVTELTIPGLLVISPAIWKDDRGWFAETYHASKYLEQNIPNSFVQDNASFSNKNILRGLHIQKPFQGKLVQVLQGKIFDVAVDLRKDSPTFGKWEGVFLSSELKTQFWIPEGFAHGFFVLSDTALFTYKCTNFYNPHNEYTLAWDDPSVGIEWPLSDAWGFYNKPLVSEKDSKGKSLDFFKNEEW